MRNIFKRSWIWFTETLLVYPWSISKHGNQNDGRYFLTIDLHCNQWSVRLLEEIRSLLRCLNQTYKFHGKKTMGGWSVIPPIRQDAQVEVSWWLRFYQKLVIPSGKLTWQWKMNLLKMYSLLKMVIFHCYVRLVEGTPCNCQSWDVHCFWNCFGTHLVHDFSSIFWQV